MDTEVWRVLTAAVKSADRRVPRRGRKTKYSDPLILRMFLWSAWHDRPLCWACDRAHYNTMFRPRQLPSVSQFSRRVKTPRVNQMLQAVNEHLTRTHTAVGLSLLDGKPLPISFCSRDPDARVGYATKGFAKAYKLHAWASADGRIPRHEVRPMNPGEAGVARGFADRIAGGLVLADANYDTKHLYQALGARDVQPLTPLKRIAVNPGPLRRRGAPAALRHPPVHLVGRNLSCHPGPAGSGRTHFRGVDVLRRWLDHSAALGATPGSGDALGLRQDRDLPRPPPLPETGIVRALHAKSSQEQWHTCHS